MKKINKKLFAYFVIILLIFSFAATIVFPQTIRHQVEKRHEAQLEEKTYTLKRQLENYLRQDPDADVNLVIKYLGPLSSLDVYVLNQDGENYAKSDEIEQKVSSEEVQLMAELAIDTTKYIQQTLTNEKGKKQIIAGVPVEKNGQIMAAMVVVDGAQIDRKTMTVYLLGLITAFVPAMLIAAIFALFFIRHFMHPIDKIAHATRELANGNYQVKTGVYDKNEFGNLARETDVLAEKLQKTKEESEKMYGMQKDYISNVSHELRTPVTVIRSSLEAMRDGVIPEEEIPEYQEQLLSETISLQRLILDMLELSRLENDGFIIEKNKINILEVLSDSVRAGRLLAKKKQISIAYEEIEEEWNFRGDYGRIRQMFLATIENAVKYSKENTMIKVQTMEKVDAFYISVLDQGCGMTEEEQKHIFDKFYRASFGKTEGTGLGMAIIGNIARRHDIDIFVQSKIDEGTKITFAIPRY